MIISTKPITKAAIKIASGVIAPCASVVACPVFPDNKFETNVLLN